MRIDSDADVKKEEEASSVHSDKTEGSFHANAISVQMLISEVQYFLLHRQEDLNSNIIKKKKKKDSVES